MDILTPTLLAHQKFSLEKLSIIKQEISQLTDITGLKDFCIYVTGSYGRHEATNYSDLDLFFITDGRSNNSHISKLSKTLIDADLIRLTNKLGFPPFSNDGQFLTIHYLEDIIDHLGSPNDDFSNYFTARLLLLLESYPVLNEEFYNQALSKMVGTYLRDFHNHNQAFLPIFLVNDVIRYWKTLCLNYEHKRNRPIHSDEKKLKTHVKNLKLVFSRKLTCYSFVIQIILKFKNLSEEELLNIFKMSPIERLTDVLTKRPELESLIKEILELYSWFIDLNNQPEADLLKYIEVKENRDNAFDKGRNEFGGKIFDLIYKLSNDSPEILKYLVI